MVQQAAYVGLITIPNQWSLDEKRVFSISVSTDDKNTLLEAGVPAFYDEFEKVFGKEMQSALPEHGPQDCAIDLLPNTEPPSGKLYPMSQDELQLLCEYIQEMVATVKIRPGKGLLFFFFFLKSLNPAFPNRHDRGADTYPDPRC